MYVGNTSRRPATTGPRPIGGGMTVVIAGSLTTCCAGLVSWAVAVFVGRAFTVLALGALDVAVLALAAVRASSARMGSGGAVAVMVCVSSGGMISICALSGRIS